MESDTTFAQNSGGEDGIAREQISPRRVVIYLVLGAAAIYLAGWTGNVAFYLTFQKPLLAQERRAPDSVLSSAAQPVEEVRRVTPEWTIQEVDGVNIPLPPGQLLEVKKEGHLIRAKFQEGEILFNPRPKGALLGLLEEKSKAVGAELDATLTDAEALREIMAVGLQSYEFSWSEPERQRYAARVLCKLVLWENLPSRRVETVVRSETGAFGALVEFENGNTKVIAVRPSDTLVIVVPPEAPAEWKSSPVSWLR